MKLQNAILKLFDPISGISDCFSGRAERGGGSFGGRIADVGCGKNKILPHAEGYDINPEKGVDFVVDITKINLFESYDTVFSIQTLQYLQNRDFENEEEVLKRFVRVLKGMVKPGGFLVVTVTNPNHLMGFVSDHGNFKVTLDDLREWFPPPEEVHYLLWGTYIMYVWRKKNEMG